MIFYQSAKSIQWRTGLSATTAISAGKSGYPHAKKWKQTLILHYRITIWSSNSASEYISKTVEIGIQIGICTLVLIEALSTVAHNPTIPQWTNDKQNVIHRCNGILSSLKIEGNSDKWHNMDKPWKQYAKWNKPVTEGQLLCGSTYMRSLE